MRREGKGREGKGREGKVVVVSPSLSRLISNKFGGVQNFMRCLYPSDNNDLEPHGGDVASSQSQTKFGGVQEFIEIIIYVG